MTEEFKQISTTNGFMKHNGGILFRTISENEYEFKTKINENHLNAAKITHGGFIAALTDAGVGTAAHRATDENICVTISLELKFISAVQLGKELVGKVSSEIKMLKPAEPYKGKGVRYSDPAFNIPFPLKVTAISKKDSSWQLFKL